MDKINSVPARNTILNYKIIKNDDNVLLLQRTESRDLIKCFIYYKKTMQFSCYYVNDGGKQIPAFIKLAEFNVIMEAIEWNLVEICTY